MENYKAIPEGFMRIGELAKKAEVTVRTLQYYDKEGLLSPSAASLGGFRLYSEKDMAKLMQILMMKELGLPLSEIKNRLQSLETKADVVNVLSEQAASIRSKIDVLMESLDDIETLQKEIEQMETVDFKKYSAILLNIQIKNKNYWMIKHFDADVLEELAARMDIKEATKIINKTNRLFDEVARMTKEGIAPSSKIAQETVCEFWELMLEVTKGDIDLMQRMTGHANKLHASDDIHSEAYQATSDFLRTALEIYFTGQKHINTEAGQKIATFIENQTIKEQTK